jgi:hypothetical protein
MAAYRLAKSLQTLRTQINQLYPKRSKASDGWIGDIAHRKRKSDHNPNTLGVVCAMDITHDPASGCDAHKLAETLRENRDPRLNYVISDSRIVSGVGGWTWRKYGGSNPHNKHCHISVKQTEKLYDDPKRWNLA